MTGKKVLYAAVGAPVVAARKLGERVAEIRAALTEEADSLSKSTSERVDAWVSEGEKLVSRITEGKMVDEIAAKVDFDQVSEQVSKLRDQLEDMLATWRASFRPEKVTAPVTEPQPVEAAPERKAAAKKPAASGTTTQSGPAMKAPAKQTPAKKTATKPTNRKAPAQKAS